MTAKKAAKATASRVYKSRADYPCTDCGYHPMDARGSASPETQTAFTCPKCGLYHEVHNSRFSGRD